MHLKNQRLVVVLPRENIQFILNIDAINVSTRSHLWIVAEVSLILLALDQVLRILGQV
jgi:hypothetical protein